MSTSKSYAVLLGLETYTSLTKGKKKGKSAARKTVGKGEKTGTHAIATGVDISKGAVKSEEAKLKKVEEEERGGKEKEKEGKGKEGKGKEGKGKGREGKGVKVEKEGGWWKFVRRLRLPGKHSRTKSLTRSAT
ncbi:hypothetical protein HOY82DRAFT_32238 [Tuber indicum]|nr:hypothetical protein HOY82DRAFT_32238 [Tuber indicum]